MIGDQLIVGDTYNYRVLIWNSWPTNNGQEADVVLGQPDMTTDSRDYSGIGLEYDVLEEPGGVFSSGNYLYVTDYTRMMVYKAQ